MTDHAFTTEVARRRVDQLPTEAAYEERQRVLAEQLAATGLSAVQTAELRLISEALDELDATREQEARDEMYAESAWLRAAESAGYDDDPRGW
jgi:hypothetical protein